MSKFKVEYYGGHSGLKEVALMNKRDDIMDIISRNNVDFDRDVKVFEKLENWELVFHKVNGEVVVHNFSEDKDKKQGCTSYLDVEKTMDFFSKEVCPSRKETQTHFDLIFDHFFGNEDISKAKLEIVRV